MKNNYTRVCLIAMVFAGTMNMSGYAQNTAAEEIPDCGTDLYMKQNPQLMENLEKERENIKKILPIYMVIFGISGLVFALMPIYFFTRPKVKEQFQNSDLPVKVV